MIITVTMNPAVDKTAEVNTIHIGGLNRLTNVVMDAGGKGINVSKTIKNLGKESTALGVLAGSAGAFIEKELDRFEIKHNFLQIEGNTRTNLKVIDKDRVLSEFNESGPCPNQEQLKHLSNEIASLLNENDILVLSGSVPNQMSKTYYYDLIQIAHTKKAKTILDADGELFKEGIKAVPNIIKPNRFELLQYFNKEDATQDELLSLAQIFIEMGVEMIVISMGKEGSYFVSKNNTYKVDPILVKAHSSVGAGDAMVAALACGMEENMEMEEWIKLCCACASGAVMTKGTKPASMEMIEELKKQVTFKRV